jgi:hypothetical protein
MGEETRQAIDQFVDQLFASTEFAPAGIIENVVSVSNGRQAGDDSS